MELMNINDDKMCQSRSIHSPHRCGWLLGSMSILLLFCVQPLLSAKTPSEPPPKTLLEQYLDCNGLEEFAFYIEYPGKTNQFPNVYWCGSYQEDNFLFIRSSVPLGEIPAALRNDIPLMTFARFESTWWRISSDPLFCTRGVWEDKHIPDEEDNEVNFQCIGNVRHIRETLLNLGLSHTSGVMMSRDGGKFTNQQAQVVIDYSITEKNEAGMPKEIVAKVLNLEGINPPIVWRKVISYRYDADGKYLPSSITHYGTREGESEQLLKYVAITELIPAKEKLPRSHFLRQEFEDASRFPKIGPSVYYVEGKKMVGYDDKSNKVYRMSPDDPRLLNEPSKRRLLYGYWISSIFITVVAFSFFWFLKKYKQI